MDVCSTCHTFIPRKTRAIICYVNLHDFIQDILANFKTCKKEIDLSDLVDDYFIQQHGLIKNFLQVSGGSMIHAGSHFQAFGFWDLHF